MEKQLTDLKTFEDACEILGITPATIAVTAAVQEDNEALVALAKLFVIVRAANKLVNDGKEWKPDFSDDNYKYWPYFDLSAGSSGFRFWRLR